MSRQRGVTVSNWSSARFKSFQLKPPFPTMKKSFCLFTVAALASIPMAHGSVFIGDFTGLGVGNPLDGYDSWIQSESNPDPSPDFLAWGMQVGVPVTDPSNGFGLGPANSYPSGSILSVSHAVDNVPLVGGPIKTTLLTSFAIRDSTNAYPPRNDYSIGIYNGSGTLLISLDMVTQGQTAFPDTNPNDKWNIYCSTIGNPIPTKFGAIFEDTPDAGALYNLSVTFTTVDANNVHFDLNVTGENNFSLPGTLSGTGMGSETITEYRVSTSIASGIVILDPETADPIPVANDWGDGLIMIAGVSIIPEPSSAMLLGLSVLGLIRRRRSA